jgi:hypothetical protein
MTTRYSHAGDDDSPTKPRKLHRTGSHTALAASGERSYTTATFVAARELGLRRARGSSHVESNRRFQAAYLCAQPPLLQEHPLPTQRLRGYDKVFASAWLDCDTLVVGTKDNKGVARRSR